MAMLWAVWCGCLHRADKFRARHERHVAILRTIAGVILIVTVALIIDNGTQVTSSTLLTYFALIVGLSLSYIDFVQSIVLGCLTGTLAQRLGRSSIDTQLWGMIAFLSAQCFSYGVTALVGFALLPRLFSLLIPDALLSEGLLLAARAAVFVLLREGMVIGLWRWVAAEYSIVSDDLRALLHG
jgi:hypothetical protein